MGRVGDKDAGRGEGRERGRFAARDTANDAADETPGNTPGDTPGDTGRVRTLADLAKIVGVSAGTVSRALAGNDLVNVKTRAKIEAIAREHGFRPNQMASKLRRQKTGVVGVAIPLGHDVTQQVSDTFFMTLLGHLADRLMENGYDLMLRRVIPGQDEDWLDRFIRSGMIDGVIIIGQSDQFERIEDIADGYLPMVVWGQHQQGQRHCVVGTDNRLGGKLAAETLIAGGARNIAFLGDIQPTEFAARYVGAKQVAQRMGVKLEALPISMSPEHAAKQIIQHLPRFKNQIDGVFAATDTIAATCLRELRQRGIEVPGQIRIVGFDDLALSNQTVPPLTTVHQDILAGARGLVDLLLRRMAGEETESLVLPPRLVVRGTT